MADLIDKKLAIDAICEGWCGCERIACKHPFDMEKDDCYWCDGCSDVELLESQPVALSHQWIPIRTIPMAEEDAIRLSELLGISLEAGGIYRFECPMPECGQDIYVCTKDGKVFADTSQSDEYGRWLEVNGDWDGIIAWMPWIRPEPYKETE